MAHDGLARSTNPVQTMSDGDTLFALGTGASGKTLGTMATEATARAVVRAVQAAQGLTVGALTLPAAVDLAPPPLSLHAMPRTLRNTLISLWALLVSAGPLVMLAVALLVAAFWWLDPTPPKRVVLATVPAQSAYEEFGKRYAKALAAEGTDVVLPPSEGSSANLQLLREGKADLGFVQRGSSELGANAEAELSSLGSLFVEPVWLFYRSASARKRSPKATLTALTQLQGLRVNDALNVRSHQTRFAQDVPMDDRCPNEPPLN